MHQINRIVEIMGTPSEEDIRAIDHVAAQEYIRSLGQKIVDLPPASLPLGQRNPIPWQQIFPQDTNPMAIDLMSGMLQFNPAKRLSLDQILSHPFLGNQTRSTFPVRLLFLCIHTYFRPPILMKWTLFLKILNYLLINIEVLSCVACPSFALTSPELLLREIVHFHPEIAPNYQVPPLALLLSSHTSPLVSRENSIRMRILLGEETQWT